MKTNELGNKILDDKNTKPFYKTLANGLILSPTKTIKREIPRRLRMLRGKYVQAGNTWLH